MTNASLYSNNCVTKQMQDFITIMTYLSYRT